MDRDYRSTTKIYRFPVDRVKGDDLTTFHIEGAGFRSSWYLVASTVVSVTGYVGHWPAKWYVKIQHTANCFLADKAREHRHAHDFSILYRCLSHLRVQHVRNSTDGCESRHPALAQASSNFVRCALSASGLAALQGMISHIGPGWTSTIFTGLCLSTAPMILAEMRWGFSWRSERQHNVELQTSPETESARS